jgi:cyclomaltodextrinase / maltogenic alpha-amylase / neopullulanase
MVKNMNLKNQTIYQVYVRNHTKEGTFKALMSDLDRIKQLGADIVHFLPIHPIGVKNRKGTLGSPYSISDYRAINPEYGTIGDFRLLVDAMHEKGLKVMIDVVYNHTSHDSVLIEKFPTSYLRNTAGETIPKVADWWDIADLIHNSEALQQELIDTLVYWTQMGVDGFRCDVASIVPLTFWRAADAAVRAVNPDVIWLAETIDPHFTADMKRQGVLYETDSDMYEVFDIQYAYDVWHIQREYYLGNRTLQEFVEGMKFQEFYLPINANKLRFLENHDQDRFAKYGLNIQMHTAMMFFLKGTALVYAGQEALNAHTPSLFDKDPIDLSNPGISDLISVLASIKKDPIFADGSYDIKAIDDCFVGSYTAGSRKLMGVFNFKEETISIDLPDGSYENLIDGKLLEVKNGTIDWDVPAIFEIA